MAQAPIKYAACKNANGTFVLGFDNLTKAEAAEYLLLLARQQDARGEKIVDEGAMYAGEGFKGATTDEVAAALGVDPFPKAAALTGGPRFVTKPAHFDHKYEPGAFGVCKRCGGEKH